MAGMVKSMLKSFAETISSLYCDAKDLVNDAVHADSCDDGDETQHSQPQTMATAQEMASTIGTAASAIKDKAVKMKDSAGDKLTAAKDAVTDVFQDTKDAVGSMVDRFSPQGSEHSSQVQHSHSSTDQPYSTSSSTYSARENPSYHYNNELIGQKVNAQVDALEGRILNHPQQTQASRSNAPTSGAPQGTHSTDASHTRLAHTLPPQTPPTDNLQTHWHSGQTQPSSSRSSFSLADALNAHPNPDSSHLQTPKGTSIHTSSYHHPDLSSPHSHSSASSSSPQNESCLQKIASAGHAVKETVSDKVSSAADAVSSATRAAGGAAKDAVVGAGKTLASGVASGAGGVAGMASKVTGAVHNQYQDVKEGPNEKKDDAKETVQGWGECIKEAAVGTKATLAERLDKLRGKISDAGDSLADNTKEVVKQKVGGAQTVFDAVKDGFNANSNDEEVRYDHLE